MTAATRYDRIPYPSAPLPRAHPHSLGGLALLHGLSVRTRKVRVLDIGCGAGRNLTWIAATMPDASCLGIDLAASAIKSAAEFALRAGVDNVRFEHRDFRQLPKRGSFDVIIANGLYSWIDAGSRAALLGVIERQLAPEGIAYVSHHEEERPWRGALLRAPDPLRAAREVPELADLDEALLWHDALAEISDPVSIRELASALPPGLDYLCDAQLETAEAGFHKSVIVRSGRKTADRVREIWWVTRKSFPAATQLRHPPEEAIEALSVPRRVEVNPGPFPTAWPPARRLAAAGDVEIMNLFGAQVELDEADRALLASLDGTVEASGEPVAFFARAGLLEPANR